MNLPEKNLEIWKELINHRVLELATADCAGNGLHAALSESVSSPGKRLRPLLLLGSAKAAGGDPKQTLDGACAVELVHTASLLLDDLPCMDNALERRGRPAHHLEFGEAQTILTAVSLLTSSFKVFARGPGDRPQRALVLLADTVGPGGMAGGQLADLTGRTGPATEEVIRTIHRGKSCSLFVAASRIGAILAGASPDTEALLGEVAEQLGEALQLLDDRRDVSEDAACARSPINIVARLGEDEVLAEAASRIARSRSLIARIGAEGDELRELTKLFERLME